MKTALRILAALILVGGFLGAIVSKHGWAEGLRTFGLTVLIVGGILYLAAVLVTGRLDCWKDFR
jgi:uncharacterized membrane protein YfcA